MLKECNMKLRQLRQVYSEKEASVNKMMHDDLLGPEEEADEEDPGVASMLKQKKMLHEGRKSLGQAIEHGQQIGTELTRHREKLSNSLSKVGSVKPDQRDHGRPGGFDLSDRVPGENSAEEQVNLLRRGDHLVPLSHVRLPQDILLT